MTHHNYLAAAFFILIPLSGVCDVFNTVSFNNSSLTFSPSRENADSAEWQTYTYIDSLRADIGRESMQLADTALQLTVNNETTRLREVASSQVVYYESLIDSLMFENFRLQLDLAVMRAKMAATDDSVTAFYAETETDFEGRYKPAEDLTIESLIAEIQRNGIKHPRIVVAQAILETGWFKSRVCHTHNNLFGLRQPWDGEYFRFERWQDSVRAYRTKVQYKYKGGPYLQWLKQLGYAEDPEYTDKLRVLLSGPLKDL